MNLISLSCIALQAYTSECVCVCLCVHRPSIHQPPKSEGVIKEIGKKTEVCSECMHARQCPIQYIQLSEPNLACVCVREIDRGEKNTSSAGS